MLIMMEMSVSAVSNCVCQYIWGILALCDGFVFYSFNISTLIDSNETIITGEKRRSQQQMETTTKPILMKWFFIINEI